MQQPNALTLVKNENFSNQIIEYYPASLKEAIKNTVVRTLDLSGKQSLKCLKGIYKRRGDNPSNGFYYDSINYNGESFKMKVHEDLRKLLKSDTFYNFEGFIEYEHYYNDFHFYVEKEISTNEVLQSKISEADLNIKEIHNQYRRLNSLHRERQKNRKTLQDLIEQKIRKSENLLVVMIGPQQNKVFNDVQTNLSNKSREYVTLETLPIKYTKENILNQVNELCKSGCQAICIVRGGGESDAFTMFDDADFIENLLTIGHDCLIMSAVGHDDDIPYLENFCDGYFSTPSMLACAIDKAVENFIKEQRYEKTIKEQNLELGRKNQKVQEMESTKKQLENAFLENNTLKSEINTYNSNIQRIERQCNDLNLELEEKKETEIKLKSSIKAIKWIMVGSIIVNVMLIMFKFS